MNKVKPKAAQLILDGISGRAHPSGFALVATVSMMVLMTLIALAMLSLSTIEQRSSGGGANEADRMARANARMALMMALGELQKAAGPDQRVTATATILGSATNPYATGTEAQDGKKQWLGVWNTSGYSPADPDTKNFMRWLVSGAQDQLDALGDARTTPSAEDIAIFEGVDEAGNADPSSTVKVPKVEVATATPGNSSYYAYWVEDQGVKADLAWNQGSFTDADREQAARLSTAPGPDHSVFSGPFATGVSHPLESGSGYIDNLDKAFSPADMPLVMADTADHSAWLKANRHDMAMNVRGVIADVKKGGLRRDLSLAFEMDDAAESESATLFNEQEGEFVGSGNATDPAQADYDQLSSPYTTPGTSLNARYLFRDFPTAGQVFSSEINRTYTVARGPSWWLIRDYANLYKRLNKSGNDYAVDARAYFPNRAQTEDLFDLHKYNQSKVSPKLRSINRENGDGADYRPVRANYAPVLLGVNVTYSLKYDTADPRGPRLKMIADPYFIVWNPYDVGLKADRFAITIEGGFAGGINFEIRDNDIWTSYGKRSHYGSEVGFGNYAQNKTGGANANVSYLLKALDLKPGEVMIYSPPNDADRSDEATTLNDELEIGLNYNSTDSGIVFDEFPNATGTSWGPVVVAGRAPATLVYALFNLHGESDIGIRNMVETNLPVKDANGQYKLAKELTQEVHFGAHVAGQEFRTNQGTRNAYESANVYMGFWAQNKLQRFILTEIVNTKVAFGSLTMVTIPTDYAKAHTKMEVFSQLNVTPIVRTPLELKTRMKSPLNMVVMAIQGKGYNNVNLPNGIDFDPFGSGDNAFYGKDYDSTEGDTTFPLLAIPKRPLLSLVELSGANIGTRLLEPTHAIGNSWKPPYIPCHSIYWNGSIHTDYGTLNDVSWQINDALFDRYYFSGIAPGFTIGTSGYDDTGGSLNKTLKRFYGIDPDNPAQTVDPATAEANPVLEPHVPSGTISADIVADLDPDNSQYNTTTDIYDGYQKIGAYSLIKGAFNVNSTSVKAWAAFIKGNKTLALKSAQGTTESEAGTPFPLSSTTSAEISPRDSSAGPEPNEEWEKFSRLTDEQIWDDNGQNPSEPDTPNDLTDDTGLAVEIVNQVKARGPFMSLSDFVNRRIGADTDLRCYQGAIQEAIEQAGINGDQTTGIRAGTSDFVPNYDPNFEVYFPYADDDGDPLNDNNYLGNRNNATGVPTEINQANILLPLAPRLSARSDTFRIRAYGEVRDSDDNIIATATCEAVVQRLPEYVDTETNPDDNKPWDDDSQTPTLNSTNQTYGRRFEIRSFRWLDPKEV